MQAEKYTRKSKSEQLKTGFVEMARISAVVKLLLVCALRSARSVEPLKGAVMAVLQGRPFLFSGKGSAKDEFAGKTSG